MEPIIDLILVAVFGFLAAMCGFLFQKFFGMSSRLSVVEAVLDIKKGAMVQLQTDIQEVKKDISDIKICLARLSNHDK